MSRVKRGTAARGKTKRLLSETKGFRGAPNRLQVAARKAWLRAGKSAYDDRRRRRRNFRRLWITRINCAVRECGVRYSEFIHMLAQKEITIDRKQLAELAFNHPEAFANLVKQVVAK
jgi:large subunit ribosomal protein L20